MRQAKNKKGKDRVAATIILCFCLITLTSIFTIKASIDKVNERAQNLPVTQQVPTGTPETEYTEEDTQEKEASATEAAAETDAPTDDEADTSAEATVIDSLEQNEQSAYLPPINMETATVTKAYAMDGLLYNQTLDQYMTHPGIDIEAPANSGVNAIADGTVTAVYEDDAYGMTIQLTLGNGIVAKYANLNHKVLVETGDVVTRGQKIGSIGQSGLYESMEKAHLHFELYQKDTLCNPAEHIDF